MSITLAHIAEHIQAELIGDGNKLVSGLASLQSATQSDLSYLNHNKYLKALEVSNAGAIIVERGLAAHVSCDKLVVNDAYVAYAKASALFAKLPVLPQGIHSTAVVAASAKIAEDAAIGPGVVIGERAVIGSACQIHANTVIGDDVHIGDQGCLWSNVTLYYGTQIGRRVIIHSGAVIGADGFGMANQQGKWVKIYQTGRVIIGDDVEIGAQTAIDRGALDDTIIEEGVKLDNQIQVGHNVKIGAHTAIAGRTGIAGSTTIGKYCMIAGGVMINGHVRIADQVIITACSAVHGDIEQSGVYSSGIYAVDHKIWRRNVHRFNQLDEMAKRLRKLEQLCGSTHEKVS